MVRLIQVIGRLTIAVLTALLISLAAAPASARNETRFVEISDATETDTFDLDSVKVIVPGRFTILSTTLFSADHMRVRLAALTMAEGFCRKPFGKYEVPPEALVLGPPDIPMAKVTVENIERLGKMVHWPIPYSVAGSSPVSVDCDSPIWGPNERKLVTHGFQSKQLFDCKRGMMGFFASVDGEPSKAIIVDATSFLPPARARVAESYSTMCARVIGESPHPLVKLGQ
jgi:hypothetical protein